MIIITAVYWNIWVSIIATSIIFYIYFIIPQLSSLRHFQNQKKIDNFFGVGIWALSGWNNPDCCL